MNSITLKWTLCWFLAFVFVCAPALAQIPGDVNGDNVINILDVELAVKFMNDPNAVVPAGASFDRANVDCTVVDGKNSVDITDIDIILKMIIAFDPSAPNATGLLSEGMDTDQDNIHNGCDNCPTVANTNQADQDNNLTGDACEGAPSGCPACADVPQLKTDVQTLKTQLATLQTQLIALQKTTPKLSVELAGYLDGLQTHLKVDATNKKVTFTGANVYVQDGTGSTECPTQKNADGSDKVDTDNNVLYACENGGLGNLIVGYNQGADTTTGAHNLVVGESNSYSSYGGFVAGSTNFASGSWSSVSGGYKNTASGGTSSVSGGKNNTASGNYSSVSGGVLNNASNDSSSVSGGAYNKASGYYSSVSGGESNTASGESSSVSGGYQNTASGSYSSVSGGFQNTALGDYSSVSGGGWNKASGWYSSVSGGVLNNAYANSSSVLGGWQNSAGQSVDEGCTSWKSVVIDGAKLYVPNCPDYAQASTVTGGTGNTASTPNSLAPAAAGLSGADATYFTSRRNGAGALHPGRKPDESTIYACDGSRADARLFGDTAARR